MAPAWVERLREGVFTSPGGVVSNFRIDMLSRIGGKKASVHEILNKSESISQDQGNRTQVFPMEIYFTGENGDEEADVFYESLREQYSVSSPGVLRHPRWGDINVMPFEYQQVEQLVTGAGIFRIPVEFREIPTPVQFPSVIETDSADVSNDITALEDTLETANESIDISDSGDAATFTAKVTDIVNVVDISLEDIVATVDDVQDQFNLIKADIAEALADGDDAVQVLSQVTNLIRSATRVPDSTLKKVQGYAQMTAGIITGFIDDFATNPNVQENLNNARIAESMGLFSVAAVNEAALSTDYATREAAGDALDFINLSFATVEQQLSLIYQLLTNDIVNSFAINHDSLSETGQIVAQTNALLLDQSFDLRTKQIIILNAPIDPLILTWRFYKDTSKLQFFIETNNLQDEEIIEVPAGREIVAYV